MSTGSYVVHGPTRRRVRLDVLDFREDGQDRVVFTVRSLPVDAHASTAYSSRQLGRYHYHGADFAAAAAAMLQASGLASIVYPRPFEPFMPPEMRAWNAQRMDEIESRARRMRGLMKRPTARTPEETL